MTRHYEKFIFVGVLLLIAVIANHAYDTPRRTSAEADPAAASLLAAVSEAVPSEPSVPAESGAVSPRESARPLAFYRATDLQPPVIGAEIALVADLRTGETYFEQDADRRWPIASLTKLMTASYAEKALSPRTAVVLRAEDFSTVGGDLGRNLRAGEIYSVQDLFRSMLLFSSNESAEALANAHGRTSFIAGMNALSEEWGLTETRFADPTGLSSANQSTARDLVRMAREIMNEHPGVLALTRLPSADIIELSTRKAVRIYSNNEFAGTPNFLGGKTGYTDEARGNLLSVFTHGDRPVAIVVMGVTGDRFKETQKLRDWFIHTYKRGT